MKITPVHQLRDDIAVVGWSCRLPGAKTVEDLWSLLLAGRCAVTRVPEDRFSLAGFGHPRRQERGKSYSWAAGILDDVWGFDPAVFGISPREAVQIDPQQRILLQLTWEALEDAGIRPSSIANSETGVFIGASQTDYGHAFFSDPAIADAHFAPGTAVAILANRISYIYGLRGPSLTIDTACSSSLVALHQAVEALRSGRIDTAIVGGTNLIASPASFIAFSQANMLSSTGLCRAFSSNADGFVRAEGAVVFVLRRAAAAQVKQNPIHGYILASDVNSDGRTNGISLPSLDAQESLLRRVYSRNGFDLNRLAFMEAHGTGTPAGDPIEATAIGRAVATERSNPLPIGSIKTNIGHLEPASGLAGVLKAILALNHGILPRSLHFDEPNPHIEFAALNLAVASQAVLLPNSGKNFAGVNSFGFGGTNAHAVVSAGRKAVSPSVERSKIESGLFALSANSNASLVRLARHYADRVNSLADEETATLASAITHRRERQSNRVVVSSTRSRDVASALNAFIDGTEAPHLISGTAIGNEMPVAFVYSGNGSQWVGMGLAAHRHNADFRARFDQVDTHFGHVAGWSLKEALFGDDLSDRLPLTSIAQPLIFAIQCACTAALRNGGLRPAAVLGHSVGELAAAEAAGILDLKSAVSVIHFRSKHQEATSGIGRMLAVMGSAEFVQEIASEAGNVEIAAINGPRAVTVAGPADALDVFKNVAKERSVAVLDLDIEYPFHTTLMTPIEQRLKQDLRDIKPLDGDVPFISTVTGACLPGSELTGGYWWRNVREPVRFAEAVRAAAKLGVRYFVEIGPRALLLKHITDSLQGEVSGIGTLAILDRSDSDIDPIGKARATAMMAGAQIDDDLVFGQDPGPAIALPHYPWEQSQFRFNPTTESTAAATVRHPFAGARISADALVWHSNIDTALYPELVDHKLGDQVIFPGTGFVEIGLAVAAEWLHDENVTLASFEILSPLDLTNGETREVMTRISPVSNSLEIFSRLRLSQSAWTLHCRCKIHAANDAGGTRGLKLPKPRSETPASAIYALAKLSGLNYGPSFRLVQNTVALGDKFISVDLPATGKPGEFLLDPMRLDAGAHGIFSVFPELRAVERGVAYIPVRMDEITLYRPRELAIRAVLEIVSKSERSIVANYHVYGSQKQLIAVLRGVRSQAVSTRRTGSLESIALVERPQFLDGELLGQTGVDAKASDIMAEAKALGLLSTNSATERSLLLEGWAMAAAYELASSLAGGTLLDIEAMVADGRLPDGLQMWMQNIIVKLEAAGLATRAQQGWILVQDAELPTSASVVQALAVERPAHAAQLLLAAALSGFVKQAVSVGALSSSPQTALSKSALDFYHATNVREANEAVLQILKTKRIWPSNRAVRILLIGSAPLAETLGSLHGSSVHLTLFEPNQARLEAARTVVSKNPEIHLIEGEQASELGKYDLIVSVDGLHTLASNNVGELTGHLAAKGLLIAVEHGPSLFMDVVFGYEPNWFGAHADQPVSPLRPKEQWQADLAEAGFNASLTASIQCGSDVLTLVIADAPAAWGNEADSEQLEPVPAVPASLVVSSDANVLAAKLRDALGATELQPSDVRNDEAFGAVILVPEFVDNPSDPVAELTRRCLDVRSCVEGIGSSQATLWLLFSGALATEKHRVRPLEAGVWAFSRTLANEYPKLDVRKIDVGSSLSPETAAALIRNILISGTAETELHVGEDGVQAMRVLPLRKAIDSKPQPTRAGMAAQLQRRSASGRRLSWEPLQRRKPGAGEIEIGVDATGLNFRDLMWAMSLLPEDMLEDGFSGATLGLECAGRVVDVGPDVANLNVGDRVMVFAASSFSTHVTVKARQATKLSDAMSCEAAATIPVAFFTAYYSLVTLAKLARKEWVLIHGGAGAVGMAAIQIAQLRGARIIATAGSSAKRDLLRAMGVKHVLDSRSMNFVDDVRDITGRGVDVVLNSLAAEAMERSIACLRPFGRFVELGKRDYISNTHIGLRPFRKNLSYFGVDVDQLIGGKLPLGNRVHAQIMRKFDDGTFVPLPHTVFEGANVSDAFQLMQQAGHVGKIVIRPPSGSSVRPAVKPFKVDAEKTHVITGAFGGFGLEAAKWLVERGARHLVLIGRRGAATPEAQAVVRDFIERGVNVIADPCDVTDLKALGLLFEVVSQTMPPICGVMHAAMVLDDAILANLDAERFERVLAPKVRGAEHLDRLTRKRQLDYFVLFSSVTTLIGNPGQGNYVAANAYMEGLARRRRQQGLPALAIGWGPITDVGVVAQNERLQSGLQKLTGVIGMRARDALDLMAQALSQDTLDPVMTISPSEGAFGSDRLPVLRSPTYAGVVGKTSKLGEGGAEAIDLHAFAEREGVEAARSKVAEVITTQLARVLHVREDDISPVRALGEIGLDSLMALELVMNLEECFGIHIPLAGSSGEMTIASIASEIIAHVGLDREDKVVATLVDQHQDKVDPTQLEALKDIMSDETQKSKRLLS